MAPRLRWQDDLGRETLNTIVKKVIPAWKDGLRPVQVDLVAPILDGDDVLCCTARVYTKAGTYIHSSPRDIQLTGGTLSECATGERKGGTFYFGNVPGLPPTILGKDTCRFFTASRLFSSFHHYPSLQQARQRVKMPTDGAKTLKHTATDQVFLWTGSRRVD
ncbi:hypothetical protein B0H13DRAFT_2654202 [Mycena leptocephala]|nr:hypothetical protein B0H13DRAFT_2654202 [Mycena leptocephala]